MLTWLNVQKTHYFSNTVHYCRSSMPRLSQTFSFLQSPSFRQEQSALIGQLTQCIVIGRTPQARVGNVTPLSIIASFSFQNKCKRHLITSLVLPSVQAREGNRVVWQTVMMLVCFCSTQAAVVWPCLPLSHTRAHTHTHTQNVQNSAFEQSIANT